MGGTEALRALTSSPPPRSAPGGEDQDGETEQREEEERKEGGEPQRLGLELGVHSGPSKCHLTSGSKH